MTVLYTPLDIEFDLPSEKDINNWFEEHKIPTADHWSIADGKHEWALLASRVEPENWRSLDVYTEWMKAPFQCIDNAGLYFHPGLEEILPGIVDLIKQMPFKQIGAAGFLKQLGDIVPHKDTCDPNKPTEPRRYMAYVTDPAYNTFYLKNEETGAVYNPTFHPRARGFLFNNTDVVHGAVEPYGENKILLSVIGVLDNDKHEELLERSVTKYKDYVICQSSQLD